MLLGAAVVAAPLFKKLGLGTVLGYLAAGIVIGPVTRYITDGEQVLHVAELGVVFLLFIIGLELKPSRLWSMRRDIFGLGLAQVLICALVLATLALASGVAFNVALVAGMGLALSSTAFALQIMEDRGTTNTPFGKRTFSILLFQDLVIVVFLALIPVLASGNMDVSGISSTQILIPLMALSGLVLAGIYLLNPLFRIIANTGAREAMIAAALFVVIGSAVLMQMAGFSMAMGAFLAGVLLAESSFRHELEADIEPFRGILLGLFFLAVGMSVDLNVIFEQWWVILITVPVAMSVKAGVIYGLTRGFGSPHNDAIRVAMVLPQHGEFGFVLFSAAVAASILTPAQSSLLIACVTISMAVTPLCVALGERFVTPVPDEDMEEDFEGAGSAVILVGFSRMGQIVAQTLLAAGIDVTIIERDANRIRTASRFGFRIYFGDGKRRDVLKAAGAAEADIIVICTAGATVTTAIADVVRREFVRPKIYTRSYDRTHTLSLLSDGVEFEIRETFESSLEMGRALLEGLGRTPEEASEIVEDVKRRDHERLVLQQTEGISAGTDKLHFRPVEPEPLLQPEHDAIGIDERSKKLLEVLEPGIDEEEAS